MIPPGTPLRWAVVMATLDPIEGQEQAGRRPVLIVSYEPFHASRLITVCPISARAPRYHNEVPIPAGHAGQDKDGVILTYHIRTIFMGRVFAWERVPGQGVQYVTDPSIRAGVRAAISVHVGLDIPPDEDGAIAVK
jgi:mRNA-degrading endonuclease toxin of MazEF toxin-antitoxin module